MTSFAKALLAGLIIGAAYILFVLWAMSGVPGTAHAHDAPAGWSYPFACCSGLDCRPVAEAAVQERPEGYVIAATGEVVDYRDSRVRHSPDGLFHWCSVAGAEDGRTICLFVPPRSY